ncbi:MAG TPA: FtsX-like permease family protein [Casimicrobiaceae bacterium]|nr:FtsX-like permease family protein [Casimicrobiaceae bacterium]
MSAPAIARWGSLARATSGALLAAGLRGRAIVATLVIALGVALGYAVQLVNTAAIGEFTSGLATLAGDADLQIRAGRAGMPEGLYAAVSRDPAVAVASPVVEIDARVVGRDDTLSLLGIDVFRAAAVTPGLVGASSDSLDHLRPDVVFLSPDAARALNVKRGDHVAFQSGLAAVEFEVAGLLAGSDTRRLGVIDIAAAQDAFDRLGRISRIDVRARPGADVGRLQQRLAALLPAGVVVERAGSGIATVARLSRAYRVNLDVLALVALFTGGLLVFSTQALSVLRRRAQFALLRSLGLTRRMLLAFVTAEGALLGATGSIVGLLAGYAIAVAATRAFGLDLGAGFFRGLRPSIGFEWLPAVGFSLLGTLAAMLGSVVPAREAARTSPALALKAGDVQEDWRADWRGYAGTASLLLGCAATLLPPVYDLPIFGYLAIALLMFGTLSLLPLLASTLLRFAPRTRNAPRMLAVAQLRHAPGQATLSLAAIVAGVSLMSSMAIMVTSFRHSLDAWLVHVLPADVYVRSAVADSTYLSTTVQHTLAHLDGVEQAEFTRATTVLLAPDQPRVTLLARDIDPRDPGARLLLIGSSIVPAATDPPPLWISEAMADRLGWSVGQRVAIPLGDRASEFTVAGVWRDYVRQQGALVVSREVYRRLTHDDRATDAALWLARGVSLDSLRASIAAHIPDADRLEITTPGELRSISLRVFDRTFAVTYALEAVAVVIGLIGLSSAFGALVLARRREFGVLRHIGMTRRQIGAMLATEGLALGGVGQIAGLLLGFVIALVLIHVVNRQSFHWSMDLWVPWPSLAVLVIALLALCTLTGWWSARQVMRADVVAAVKDDW